MVREAWGNDVANVAKAIQLRFDLRRDWHGGVHPEAAIIQADDRHARSGWNPVDDKRVMCCPDVGGYRSQHGQCLQSLDNFIL